MKKYISTLICLCVVFFVISCNTTSEFRGYQFSDDNENVYVYKDIDSVSSILFNKFYNDEVICISSCSSNNIRTYVVNFVDVLNSSIKTKSPEGGEAAWIHWGKACGTGTVLKFYKFLVKEYGDNCYEIRAEPAKDGCRELYHRKCQ